MSFTVEEVINRARDKHPSFTGETTPDAVLFRFIDDLHREVVQKTLQWNSSVLSSEETISFPLATFEDGHAFPAYDYLQGGTVVFSDTPAGERALNIVPWSHRFDPGVTYPAYMQAGTLYFAGTEDDWTGVDEVVVRYVPEVVDLTDPSSQPITPDRSRKVFIEETGYFLGKRRNAADENDPVDLAAFREDVQKAWKLYQEWLGQRESRAESTHWRAVW